MGRLSLPGRLALDTDCLIYLLDAASERGRFLLRELDDGSDRQLVASVLAVGEVLVEAYAKGDARRAREVRDAIGDLPGMEVVPVSLQIADLAAAIRGRTRLKLPNAIQLATAIASDAEAFLTNDRDYRDVDAGLPVLRIDELLER